MTFLVDPVQQKAAIEFATQNPVEGFDPGFVERFKADRFALIEGRNGNVRELHRAEIQKEFQRSFYENSGLSLPNWLGGASLKAREQQETVARGTFDSWKAQNPNSDLVFPDEQYLEKETIRRAQEAIAPSEKLGRVSTSWSSTIGGFLGTAAGAMQDPINAMSMAFGAGAAQGILRTALIEGGIALGSETAIQTINYDFRKKVEPNYSVKDAVYEISAAGAGGAILGGGIKGIAAAWHRAKTGEWPRHVVDASNVVAREAAVPSSRFDKSAHGEAVYRAAVEKSSDDLFKGQPVEIPQEAFLQSNARPGRVYDADGRSVGVQYEVVEADSLVTSHNNDLSLNADFPQELQPRDRSRAMSHQQIQSISGNLQPERLGPSPDASTGAPIIGPDGLVESGNGRVMAIRRAYMDNGASSQSYRNYLRSQNYDIEGMSNPVLVARRVTDLDDTGRVGFVTAANRSTAMRLSAPEQALSDARILDDALLFKLKDESISATGNQEFVRQFMQKLPNAEQGELIDATGKLSLTGERRIAAALMGRAYGEPVLLSRALEDVDSNIKSLAGSLSDSAAPWAIMRDAVARGDIPRGMDITDDLLEAVRMVMKARDEGRAVKDLINQAEMFGGPNEIAKLIARAMFGDGEMKRAISRKKLATFLRDYADEAMKNDAGDRLFGAPLDNTDVLRTALSKAEREDLINVVNERLTPEKIDEIAASSDTADAVVRDAQQILTANNDAMIRERRWERESKRLIEAQSGEIPRALHHPEVGAIDVIWGDYDPVKKSGLGLSKIVQKHPEVLENLPQIISGLNVETRSANRIRLSSPTHKAVVRLDYDGQDKKWLMTAFEINRSAGEFTDRPSSLQMDGHSSSISPADANILSELQQNKTQPVMVDLGDGLGERSLNDILQEADNEIAAATHIEACALGRETGA